MRAARENCLVLLVQDAWRAAARACANTGNRIAARIAMIAMTTSSSISVKPRFRDNMDYYLPILKDEKFARRAKGQVLRPVCTEVGSAAECPLYAQSRQRGLYHPALFGGGDSLRSTLTPNHHANAAEASFSLQ